MEDKKSRYFIQIDRDAHIYVYVLSPDKRYLSCYHGLGEGSKFSYKFDLGNFVIVEGAQLDLFSARELVLFIDKYLEGAKSWWSDPILIEVMENEIDSKQLQPRKKRKTKST